MGYGVDARTSLRASAISDGRRRIIRRMVTLREHIVRHLGCANCGAEAGSPCRHDYGCVDSDRTVK